MTKLGNSSIALRGFATMAFLVVILAGVKAASPIVVPFVLSAFIAVVCHPIIGWMTRHRVPKAIAVMLLMVFIVLMGLWLASLVGSSVNAFTKQLPLYRDQLIEQFSWIIQKLQALNIQISKEQVLAYFDPGMALSMTTNMLSGVGNVMANLFLIILTIVFMLFEAETLPKKVHLALEDPEMRQQQIDRFLSSVNQYMVIKSLVSLATAFIVGIGLTIIGVDYPLLWAVLAFLFNYIPNIGSIIAAIPAILLAFVQLGPAASGATAILFLSTNMVMGNLVEPKFMGKGLGLSTLVVFLSLIFWGWLLGSVGMLLSVPLTMIVKIALESSTNGNWFAIMLADDVDAKIKERQQEITDTELTSNTETQASEVDLNISQNTEQESPKAP